MFEKLCERTHPALLAEKCPWCGQEIIGGQPAKSPAHEIVSEMSHLMNAGLAGMGDEWFSQRLGEIHQGGEVQVNAFRQLQIAWLKSIGETLEQWKRDHPEFDEAQLSVGFLNEFHARMLKLLKRFNGPVAEFLPLLQQEMYQSLEGS